MINLSPPQSNELEVSIFGPGRGECIVLHVGNGEWFIIDSCKEKNTKLPIALEYLNQIDVDPSQSVKGIVITHWHTDHTGGLLDLVKACENANLWISAALLKKEIIELCSLYSSEDIGLPSIGNRIQEFAKTIAHIKEHKKYKSIKITKARTMLKQHLSGDPMVHLVALSPSDVSVTFALSQVSKYLDKEHTSRGFYSTSNENFNSIALHVRFNDINILLGSDLESKDGNENVGWMAVINDQIFEELDLKKGNIYKVAHHGSKTGHSKELWDELLAEKPLSVLTRYSINVPKNEDISRIRKLSSLLYTTTVKEIPKVKRDKSVVNTMKARLKAREVVYESMGHVQIRGTELKSLTTLINQNAKKYSAIN